MLDDGHPTASSTQQQELEHTVKASYASLVASGVLAKTGNASSIPLRIPRDQHATYLQAGLGLLPNSFTSLDAARPWLCYWILHALALLEAPLPQRVPASAIVHFLALCQAPGGGFGGGPEQPPHLAPTYAAVAALVTLGTPEALALPDRRKTLDFLLRMCQPAEAGGGMAVCEGGEVDVRGCYTALAVAHMLCLDKAAVAERAGLVDLVRRCQTYEGGLGGEPGTEAHGGYAFCGLAALALLGREAALDLPRLLRWAALCQGSVEGGFRGRTNKLVDGCYSYWQGALFPLVAAAQRTQHERPEERSSRGCDSPGPQAETTNMESTEVPELPPSLLEAWAAGPKEDGDGASSRPESKPSGIWHDPAEATAAVLCQPSPVEVDSAGEEQRLSASRGHAPQPAQPPPRAASCLYNAAALQLWLLHCCTGGLGGMRDKPGKRVDFYHTCYCLSGLAVAQQHSGLVVGGDANRLPAVDVRCNVLTARLEAALAHYRDRPL